MLKFTHLNCHDNKRGFLSYFSPKLAIEQPIDNKVRGIYVKYPTCLRSVANAMAFIAKMSKSLIRVFVLAYTIAANCP